MSVTAKWADAVSAPLHIVVSRLLRVVIAALWLGAMALTVAPVASVGSPVATAAVVSGMEHCDHSGAQRSSHVPSTCAGVMACCAALPVVIPLASPLLSAFAVEPVPTAPAVAGRNVSPLFEPPRASV